MKKTNSTNALSQDTQAPDWKFWLWLTSAFLVVLVVAVIFTAWAVKHVLQASDVRLSKSQARMVMAVADFPGLVKTALFEVRPLLSSDPLSYLIDRKTSEKPNWVRHFPEPEDTGYLLFSGVDPVAKKNIVQLIKIADGSVVASWHPDWSEINNQITDKKFAPKGSSLNLAAIHPLLLADGDIIYNTFSALVRQNPCSPKPVWVLDEIVDHSNELDETGTALWSSSVSQDGLADNPWLRDKVRDDALAHISTNGRLLDRRSFARILRNNGMESMLLGTAGAVINADPIHINQISVAKQNSRYWKRGDLLISARHLSTLFLYRPSTDKIIWHQTGPWMNQHSVNFVDDHRISVFNNNVVSGAPPEHAFMQPDGINQVLVYDFDTKQVSQPFAPLLAIARPITMLAGLAQILPDGGLFLEEEFYGRHLRFTKNKLLWSRVNDYDDKRIGIVSWSRYLTSDEASVPLKALASRSCSAAK
jgi:hypothetical protein